GGMWGGGGARVGGVLPACAANWASVWRGLGSVGPGATPLTLILGAKACARVVVAVKSALLLNVYEKKRGLGLSTRWSTILTIDASRPSGACAAKACERKSGASRFTAIAHWKRTCDNVSISSGSNSPALLTSSVSRPNAAAAGTRPRTAS